MVSYESVMEMMKLNKTCYIKSANDAIEKLLNDNDEEEENNVKRLYEITEAILSQDNYVGLADEFHNLAVTYAKEDYEDYACKILKIGLTRYPGDMDLLADFLYYGIASGETEQCKEYYQQLQQFPKKEWNWRAFTFTIKFFSGLLKSEKDSSKKDRIKNEILELAREFKNYYSDQEKSYLAMSEVYQMLNDRKAERGELEKAVKKFTSVQSCALRLADLYFEKGYLDKTIELLNKCICNVVNPQPSISEGYSYLLLAICKMQQLYKDGTQDPILNKDEVTKKCVKDIYLYYEAARISLRGSSMLNSMENHIKTLELRSGILREDDY